MIGFPGRATMGENCSTTRLQKYSITCISEMNNRYVEELVIMVVVESFGVKVSLIRGPM